MENKVTELNTFAETWKPQRSPKPRRQFAPWWRNPGEFPLIAWASLALLWDKLAAWFSQEPPLGKLLYSLFAFCVALWVLL